MSKQYNCLPSTLMNIEDEYTAYCFNEACCNLMNRIEDGEEPLYRESREEQRTVKSYSNFKDLYENMEG